MIEMKLDYDFYMKLALNEAQLAFNEGEVPVGAVLVSNNQIITKCHNQTELLTDSTAHAEILCLTSAFSFLNTKYLPNSTLFVTLEPCVMCAGALYWSQLGRLVYGASDTKRGYTTVNKNIIHPKTEVISGILANECEYILKEFFKILRKR